MRAADEGEVTVSFEEPLDNNTAFIEVTGKVRDGDSIDGWVYTNIGDNFDLATYNDAVTLMQKFPTPFHA